MQIVTIINGKLNFYEKQIDNRRFDPLLLSSIPDVNELLKKYDLHSNTELEDFIERSGIMMDGNDWDQEQADSAAFEQILLRRNRYNLN